MSNEFPSAPSNATTALSHLLDEFDGYPDNVLVQLSEYIGDEIVADDRSFTPGENGERAATLGQLRSIVRPA